MSAEWVSVVGAVSSGGFALAAALVTRRAALRDRTMAADELAMRYRLPLVHAAFDLQARLYSIGGQGFLSRFYGPAASPSEREYAIGHTMHLVAQYLCFSEIIRRGTLFLDPVDRRHQKALIEAMEAVRDTFSNTLTISTQTLCILRGEQRAVGEVMLAEADGSLPGAPRWDCLGYAAFMTELEEQKFERWFRSLHASLEALASDLVSHDERLVELQHRLVDLVNLVDPDFEHCPRDLRRKLDAV